MIIKNSKGLVLYKLFKELGFGINHLQFKIILIKIF